MLRYPAQVKRPCQRSNNYLPRLTKISAPLLNNNPGVIGAYGADMVQRYGNTSFNANGLYVDPTGWISDDNDNSGYVELYNRNVGLDLNQSWFFGLTFKANFNRTDALPATALDFFNVLCPYGGVSVIDSHGIICDYSSTTKYISLVHSGGTIALKLLTPAFVVGDMIRIMGGRVAGVGHYLYIKVGANAGQAASLTVSEVLSIPFGEQQEATISLGSSPRHCFNVWGTYACRSWMSYFILKQSPPTLELATQYFWFPQTFMV